jgi:uncharacterized protein (DUF697 family)/tellurite resistance protein
MNETAQRSLLTIALMAAFTDGDKSDAERAEVRRIADSLGAQAAGLHVPALMQELLLGRVDLAQAVGGLDTPALRQLAYELAVCVCDADGTPSAAERAFLQRLKAALGGPAVDTAVEAQAEAIAAEIPAALPSASTAAPLTGGAAAAAAAGAVAGIAASGLGMGTPAAPTSAQAVLVLGPTERAALEKSILNQSILCGALELLPQSWASMAIIPLQVRLVYAVGKAHGVALDQGHIREFIATVGVGMASQYLEQFGRKLLGGLLGSVAGGLGRGIGRAGAGMAMSFATTYALGHVALRYYGGGRQMSTAVLRQTYDELLGNARGLQSQVLPQIEQRARSLDAAQVMQLVRQPLA